MVTPITQALWRRLWEYQEFKVILDNNSEKKASLSLWGRSGGGGRREGREEGLTEEGRKEGRIDRGSNEGRIDRGSKEGRKKRRKRQTLLEV